MRRLSVLTGLVLFACGEPGAGDETSSALQFECPPRMPCFFVRNTSASGFGSFAQAIEDANDRAGRDYILFSILGPGPHVIESSVYATDPVYIDGYSQAGAARATATAPAVLQIVIDGQDTRFNGVTVEADDSHVTGLVVQGHTGTGIGVTGYGNVVEGCHVGTDAAGATAVPNARGIGAGRGQFDDGSTPGAYAVIGGNTPGERNVISGNTDGYGGGIGVVLSECPRCLVTGNYIGTDATGALDLGNDVGVMVFEGEGIVIGGTSPELRNLISGNLQGVDLRGAGTRVQGNYIGTDSSGMLDLGNVDGIVVNYWSGGNVIGGTAPGAGNLISGSLVSGVQIWGDDNRMRGNVVGLDALGSSAIPNIIGVVLGGLRNVVGGTTAVARNVISGNTGNGVAIQASLDTPLPSGNAVLGNYVGLAPAGMAAIGNGGAGILLTDGGLNLIGGPGAAGNVISGNAGDGVRLESWSGLSGANSVAGNAIGTDPSGTTALGNGGAGVRVTSGANNWIGGTVSGQGNRIAFNGEAGVAVLEGSGHAVLGNSIAANGALGIDLNQDGVTANDGPGDPDTGANGLQNSPRITAITVAGSSATIGWELRTTPNLAHRIELFASASCDASGSGEAERLLTTFSATTNAAGVATGQVVTSSVTRGEWVTGTASAILGPLGRDTSELARCVRVP